MSTPRSIEPVARLAEVALHVDDEERGMSRVDELLELGEDLLALDLDHRSSFRPAKGGDRAGAMSAGSPWSGSAKATMRSLR